MNGVTPSTGLRGHARRLAAALVIVALGLVGGLGLFEGPLHASSSLNTNGNDALAAPPGGPAYQAYRIDERAEVVSAADAWLAYRAGERDALSSADPFQAWLSYRAGERASLP